MREKRRTIRSERVRKKGGRQMKLENHHPDLQTFIRTTKKVSLSYLKTTTTVTTHKNVKSGW